jgi:hypothetical protein
MPRADALTRILTGQRTGTALSTIIKRGAGVFDKLYDDGGAVFNVKHPRFGAAGDGLNDDTAAIQATIDAVEASTSSGIVYFPPGNYLISDPLVIKGISLSLDGTHRGAIALVGAGRGLSKIIADSSWTIGDVMLDIGNGGSFSLRTKEIRITDLWLDGNGKDADIIKLTWVTRSRLERVLVYNTEGHGIWQLGGWDIQYRNVTWQYCGGDGSHFGYYATMNDATQVLNYIWFMGCRWEAWPSALATAGGHVKIDNSGGSGSGQSIRFDVCKFHGTSNAGKLSTTPTIELIDLKQITFFACNNIWSKGSFYKLTDCTEVRWAHIDTGGQVDTPNTPVYHFELVNVDNAVFDSVMSYITGTSFISIDSNCSNIKILPSCHWGAGTIATDASGRAWVATTANDEMTVADFQTHTTRLRVERSSTTAPGLEVRVSGDSDRRCYIRADGQVWWGDGSSAVDLGIFRVSSNNLGFASGDTLDTLPLKSYTDATRGAPGTAGRVIFNTTDGQLNIDDGVNWTLPDGTTT